MRLTVHLSEVEKTKTEFPVKGKPGSFVIKEKIINTLSFNDVQLEDVDRIINEIESSGAKISKHSLSGDGAFGNIKKRKKS